jgi:hypothetical protein
MRDAAKKAQERSDRVFLTVYLRDKPTYVDAVVIGLGAKSFSVLIPRWGEECRMFVDEMEGVEATYDEAVGTVLVLIKGQGQGQGQGQRSTVNTVPVPVPILQFSKLTLSLLTPVVVYLSAKEVRSA